MKRSEVTLKGKGNTVKIKEQIIWQDVSGLTIEFEVVEDSDLPYRLKLYGNNLLFGNREFLFDEDGELGGRGTCTSTNCPDHLT